MCSAIAATGVPALVMAKGHVIDGIPEVGFACCHKLHGIHGCSAGAFGGGRLRPGLHSHKAGCRVPQEEQGLGRCRQVNYLLVYMYVAGFKLEYLGFTPPAVCAPARVS